MNPEAAEWLESLDERSRLALFVPALVGAGELYTIKPDHESCGLCPQAIRHNRLTVVE